MAVVAGRFRAALGPVFVLDPTSRDMARFNPLLEIREGDNLVADCQVAAEVLARVRRRRRRQPVLERLRLAPADGAARPRPHERASRRWPTCCGSSRGSTPSGTRGPSTRTPRASWPRTGHGREAPRQHQPDGLGRPAGAGGPDAAAPDRRERLPRLRPAGGRSTRLGLPHGTAVARRPAPAVHAPARAEPRVRAARGGRPHRRRPGEAARDAPAAGRVPAAGRARRDRDDAADLRRLRRPGAAAVPGQGPDRALLRPRRERHRRRRHGVRHPGVQRALGRELQAARRRAPRAARVAAAAARARRTGQPVGERRGRARAEQPRHDRSRAGRGARLHLRLPADVRREGSVLRAARAARAVRRQGRPAARRDGRGRGTGAGGPAGPDPRPTPSRTGTR